LGQPRAKLNRPTLKSVYSNALEISHTRSARKLQMTT